MAGEAYLDGYGFTRAAQRYAGNHLDAVADLDSDVAMQIGSAISALGRAYQTAMKPEELGGDAAALTERATAINDAVKSLG